MLSVRERRQRVFEKAADLPDKAEIPSILLAVTDPETADGGFAVEFDISVLCDQGRSAPSFAEIFQLIKKIDEERDKSLNLRLKLNFDVKIMDEKHFHEKLIDFRREISRRPFLT